MSVVSLQKDPKRGLGIKLAGASTVASLARDGPAYREGTIQPGNRIISINGCSTEGKT